VSHRRGWQSNNHK